MRTVRGVVALSALALALAGCSSTEPEAEQPEVAAEEEAADEAEAEAEAEEEPAPEPEPEPVSVAAAPAELTPPEGFSAADPPSTDGSGLATANVVWGSYNYEQGGEDSPEADAAAFVSNGLTGESAARWTRPAEDDREDSLLVVQATFETPEQAAAEFERLRDRALAKGQDVVEASDTQFSWGNAVMVQMDPNTGQAVGGTPASSGTAVLIGASITVVDEYFGDETQQDPALTAAFVSQLTSA